MSRALILLAALLWAAGLARDGVDRWVDATVLPPLDIPASVEVLDRDGRLLRAYTVDDGRWRLATAPEAVSADYLEMLIAYEDKRFWRHGGVDGWAALRAAAQALRHGRVVSGASTLSMQAARLLEESGTGQWPGKLRQIRVAWALERRLGKETILSIYLNRAPFGGNLEGVRSATRAYFGKDPGRLSPAEAALLVALPQAPEARRPDRHPDTARAARDRVLRRTGQPPSAAPIPTARHPFPAHAPHFADRARVPEAHRVRTTLDRPLQIRLERLARRALAGHDKHLTAAILVADHQTGETLASVGNAAPGDPARKGWVDMTRAVRSPGSTLKPLIYALAFDQGLAHPETLVDDRPMDFGGYAPVNFDGQFRGTLRVRDALAQSLNIPAVHLTEALGPAALIAALRRAGSDPQIPLGAPGLAIALGGLGLTLEELVVLYSHFAAGGAPVTSPAAAWLTSQILASIPAPKGGPAGIAYKTGTSYGHRDAWAIGYDGRHVVGVWMGRADGTPVPGVFGADTAAPLLFETFTRIARDRTPLPPPPPETLLVSTAELPKPLQRFATRSTSQSDAPRLAFPPDGATLETSGTVLARVAQGTPPFTWLAAGQPVAIATRRREISLTLAPGAPKLTVIDAQGRAAHAQIEIRPPG